MYEQPRSLEQATLVLCGPVMASEVTVSHWCELGLQSNVCFFVLNRRCVVVSRQMVPRAHKFTVDASFIMSPVTVSVPVSQGITLPRRSVCLVGVLRSLATPSSDFNEGYGACVLAVEQGKVLAPGDGVPAVERFTAENDEEGIVLMKFVREAQLGTY